MELGSEFAKGAAEKVLGVKLPVLMRILLPGLLATAVLYPGVIWLLGHLPSDTDHWWQRIVAFIVLIFFLGALISTLNSEIYKLYEGRILWPEQLSNWGRKRQQGRVARLYKAAVAAGPGATYDELWYQLRIYPTNEQGDPVATQPTQLGNLLAGYEQYPKNRYGMDAVFYWPRIWLLLEKEKKEEVDGGWSVADGFLTLSAISFAGGVLWIGQCIGAGFHVGLEFLPFQSAACAFLAGSAWLALGFILYRLSLPFHRDNGEVFKAIFDVYRDKIWNLTSLRARESDTWRATWVYLQYHLLLCPNCRKKYNPATSHTCANCGFGMNEANRNFRESGKFPS
jgi:ribosomal protein L37E